jgi:hypothetical protein
VKVSNCTCKLLIFPYTSTKFRSLPKVSSVNQAAVKPIEIRIIAVIDPPITKLFPVKLLSDLNKTMIKGKAPLTIFGILIAADALRFVPNCSALIVIYTTVNPVPYPSPAQMI